MGKKTIFFSLIAIFLFFFIKQSFNEEIVGDKIVIGQSTVLSGPSEKLGYEFTIGALSYFKYINQKGGIYNREILLKTLDDYYEPEYAIQNTLDLIEKDKVFAMFGEVGTPTSKAVLPIINQYKVPFLMPFTGADFLRDKKEKYVINLRTSYENEIKALIKYLRENYKTNRFSVFYQNDSYGKVGLDVVKKTLKKYDLEIISEGRYRRNTLSYRNSLLKIEESNPEAVIIIGSYKTIASFIKDAKKLGMNNTKFCNISFVGSSFLINELYNQAENILISQVVPSPWDRTHEAVKEYQEIYSTYYPKEDLSFLSLEGFLAAKLLVKALEKAGPKLSKEKFLESFKNLDKNSLDGLEIFLSQKSNEALKEVYITDFFDHQFRTLQKVKVDD